MQNLRIFGQRKWGFVKIFDFQNFRRERVLVKFNRMCGWGVGVLAWVYVCQPVRWWLHACIFTLWDLRVCVYMGACVCVVP